MSDEIAGWIKEQVLAADFIEWFDKKYKINTEYHGIKMSWERVHPSNEVMLQEYKKEKRETMKSVKLNIHIYSALAVPDCKITVKPKRKSWIEKIRDYDRIERKLSDKQKEFDSLWKEFGKSFDNGCQMVRVISDLHDRIASTEEMRDHYKTVFSETRNELVKQRSIINENNKILGRRLKFSVGHNHIEIIVGNPVTYAKNISSDGKKIEWDISRCSHKDTYDWKLGVRMALDNLCDDRKYSDKLRRDLRKELARKYPEVFEVKK